MTAGQRRRQLQAIADRRLSRWRMANRTDWSWQAALAALEHGTDDTPEVAWGRIANVIDDVLTRGDRASTGRIPPAGVR